MIRLMLVLMLSLLCLVSTVAAQSDTLETTLAVVQLLDGSNNPVSNADIWFVLDGIAVDSQRTSGYAIIPNIPLYTTSDDTGGVYMKIARTGNLTRASTSWIMTARHSSFGELRMKFQIHADSSAAFNVAKYGRLQ